MVQQRAGPDIARHASTTISTNQNRQKLRRPLLQHYVLTSGTTFAAEQFFNWLLRENRFSSINGRRHAPFCDDIASLWLRFLAVISRWRHRGTLSWSTSSSVRALSSMKTRQQLINPDIDHRAVQLNTRSPEPLRPSRCRLERRPTSLLYTAATWRRPASLQPGGHLLLDDGSGGGCTLRPSGGGRPHYSQAPISFSMMAAAAAVHCCHLAAAGRTTARRPSPSRWWRRRRLYPDATWRRPASLQPGGHLLLDDGGGGGCTLLPPGGGRPHYSQAPISFSMMAAAAAVPCCHLAAAGRTTARHPSPSRWWRRRRRLYTAATCGSRPHYSQALISFSMMVTVAVPCCHLAAASRTTARHPSPRWWRRLYPAATWRRPAALQPGTHLLLDDGGGVLPTHHPQRVHEVGERSLVLMARVPQVEDVLRRTRLRRKVVDVPETVASTLPLHSHQRTRGRRNTA